MAQWPCKVTQLMLEPRGKYHKIDRIRNQRKKNA